MNDALKAAVSREYRPAASGILVIAEMALAMVLLVGAGLMINTFLRLHGVNPGLDARNVLTMEVFLQDPHYWQPGPHLLKKVSPEVSRFYQHVLSGIEHLPGVESVGMIGQLPTRYRGPHFHNPRPRHTSRRPAASDRVRPGESWLVSHAAHSTETWALFDRRR